VETNVPAATNQQVTPQRVMIGTAFTVHPMRLKQNPRPSELVGVQEGPSKPSKSSELTEPSEPTEPTEPSEKQPKNCPSELWTVNSGCGPRDWNCNELL
jgi:hypothetical protein